MKTLPIILTALLVATTACDVPETPKVEAKEAVQAVKEGSKDINKEIGDVIEAGGDEVKKEVDKVTDKVKDAAAGK